MLVRKPHESLFSQKKKNTINVTVSMPEWLWKRVCELLTMIKHKRRYRNVVTGDRSESHLVKQHGMEKQRLAVCARHTKNGRTKPRAKSSPRNHKCVAGPLHLTIWWWATSVLRFSCPVQGFVRNRSTDMLQASRRPQKMMPCSGTSFVATVDLSIS